MSSIERAMNKLAGVEPGEPAAETPEAQPVPPPPPVQASAPEPAPAETRAPSRDRQRTAPTSKARPGDVRTKNFINLDLERLAAAAFLTPDQTMTRQSEEFQHIKRRLLGNLASGIGNNGRPPNLILITSSVPSEGKTFVSTNLAISIAMEMDHTVLAVDTDIMKRDLTRVFGLLGRPGLFDMLAEPGWQLEDLLVRTNIPNLVVLPSGNYREGSTELLASLRMKELSNEISGRYSDRVVILDSPPVLATTTATALAPLAGQIILVAEAGKTKHETLREAIQILDAGRITGLVLNKSRQQSVAAYDYYGSYYRAKH